SVVGNVVTYQLLAKMLFPDSDPSLRLSLFAYSLLEGFIRMDNSPLSAINMLLPNNTGYASLPGKLVSLPLEAMIGIRESMKKQRGKK
ncbi:MAG: hypothetical protein AABW88_03700, partial [Nanoarchaeota archaeon]